MKAHGLERVEQSPKRIIETHINEYGDNFTDLILNNFMKSDAENPEEQEIT